MEAIGVLAGSIAHDLNNILSGVVSYPDLLLATMPEEMPLRKPLETIRAAGAKAAKIVQNLLSLSRRGMQAEELVSLNRLIMEYLESPECLDLLRHHGQVELVTENFQEGLLVLGSPAHYTERILEPFFSLKTPGRSSTGLGLAVVWGTITDHNGFIEVASSEGQGTRFLVILDMLMLPGIDGLDTYKRIRDYNPQQKVIIVSGFSQSERAKEALSLMEFFSMCKNLTP